MESYSDGSLPEFIEEDVFKTIIPIPFTGKPEEKPALKPSVIKRKNDYRLGERLGENETKILKAISVNTQTTIKAMAEEIGLSTTAVENNVKRLKEKNLIERIGSARGGKWKLKI